jgi:outer membrane lipoprotein-sorting protein
MPRRRRCCQVTELGEDTSGTAWLGLVPLESVGSFEGIRIGFDAEGLRGMELKDGFGQTTRLEFTAVRRNPDLDGTLFRFTPPAGVDVIRGQ